MQEMLSAARAAKKEVSRLGTQKKNEALEAMAAALLSHQERILAANEQDLQAAQGHISAVMLDRLRLTPDRIRGPLQPNILLLLCGCMYSTQETV